MQNSQFLKTYLNGDGVSDWEEVCVVDSDRSGIIVFFKKPKGNEEPPEWSKLIDFVAESDFSLSSYFIPMHRVYSLKTYKPAVVQQQPTPEVKSVTRWELFLNFLAGKN